MAQHRHRSDAGFSLIELMVAVSIFSVVALMAQQALVTALRNTERLDAQGERIAQLQFVVSRLTRDVEAATDRAARDGSGMRAAPFLLTDGGKTLEFVRVALPDPTGRDPGAFHRVRYSLDTETRDRTVRRAWRRVDAPPGPADRTWQMPDLVTGLSFETLSDAGWSRSWPTADHTDPALPRAVAITIQTGQFDTIRRVVVLR